MIGPIAWFVTGPVQIPYTEMLAREIINAMHRGRPEEFEHAAFELVPIP